MGDTLELGGKVTQQEMIKIQLKLGKDLIEGSL